MSDLLQAWIFFTGAASIWYMSAPRARDHYIGCWIGLLGQPAWFYTALSHSQWGMFLLSVIFSLSYLRGIRHYRRTSLKDPFQ